MTPFLDIWNKIAGNMGIVTERMHQSRLDMAAEQEQTLKDAQDGIAAAMQGADPEQSALLAAALKDRQDQAAANIQLIQQGRMPQPLPTSEALLAPFYSQREQLRQGQEATQAAQQLEYMKGLHGYYQKALNDVQVPIDRANTAADTVLNLASAGGLGYKDKAVQAKFRALLNSSGNELQDAVRGGGPIGELLANLMGASDQHEYTPDEITKGVAAWRAAQLAEPIAQKAALQKSAIAQGFQLDEGGGLADLNVPQYGAPTPAVPAGAPTPALQAPTGATVVPGQSADKEQEGSQIVRNAATGGILGHLLGHGLVNRAASALTGSSLGRAAGPVGMAAGAVLGAVAPQVIEHYPDTLDQRLHNIAGDNIFEQNGQIVDSAGNPVSLPRGVAEQVRRRALARRQAAMLPTN